jgi:hypothetical protein
MAIVGTAYVRLRVIGDKLKGDISNATKQAVKDSAPDLKHSGEDAGGELADGMTRTVERDTRNGMERIGDDIGNAIGNAMGNSLGRSLRNRMGTAIRNGLTAGRTELNKAQDFFKPVSDKFEKFFGDKSKHFEGVFKNALVSGISLAAIALPSALAFLGAAIGAVAATAITALSAIGPAAAGAALTGIAAFAALKITVGLVGLAMKQQTPALQDFQKRLDGFKTSIATPIQAGMLSGFNAAIRISAPTIKGLTPMLKELGNNIGDVAIQFADTFRQGANLERLQRILTVNNDVVKIGGGAVSNLAVAFSILLDHLSPITLFLADMVSDMSQWTVNTLQGAEASGKLDDFITKMFDSLRYFVGILVDFAAGIWNVFSAAHGASDGMLVNLHDAAATFRAWTGDPANREQMINFFTRMRDVSGQVFSVLKDIAGAALGALDSTNVTKFTGAMDTLRSLGPPIATMFNQIRDAAGDKLQKALINFVNMVTQLANSGVLGTLTSALSDLFWIISQLLQIPGIGPLLAFGAGLLAMFKTVKLLWVVLGPIVEILWTLVEVVGGALVAAFGWIPVVIALVVAALVWFFTQTKIGRAIIEAVWNAIKVAIGAVVDALVAAWNWMVDAFKVAVAWVVDLAQTIWHAIETAFNAVVDAVSTAFTAVWNVITTIWNAIWGFLKPIIQGIWDFIKAVFNEIVSIIEWYLNLLWQIWIRVWPILALPIRILYGVIILVFQAIWDFISFIVGKVVDFVVWAWNGMVSGVTTALQAVWDFIQYVWNAVWGFIQPIIQAIVDFFVDRWNTLVNNIKLVLDWISGIISDVWNGIKNFLTPIIDAIVGFFKDRWDTLTHNIQIALNWVKGIISDIWNGITGFISGAMDKISGLVSKGWDFVTSAGHAALDGIKAAVNVVIDAINWVIGGINWAINLANKLPGPDIPDIPKIPRLARGGIVPATAGGTLSIIGEAGRPERVEPLDPSGLSARDRALIDRLAGAAGAGSQVSVYIGTRELTELVDFVVEDREDRLADRVVTGSKVA